MEGHKKVILKFCITLHISKVMIPTNEMKQAGAELCQAQEKLGLAKLDLYSMKLCLSSIDTKH